ncbi:hypothetical protein [Microbulbifer sp. VAAF005]|uniref:hypothetical protein n=1 Tax=Microbulbifer sp. VAAF005 TaxID=3034230 RepID=UPI0024AD87AD|nr:hypothetical protein [Microbulbifer sp. VAAF005]WHI48559.1 hypothetical protein P0078_09375 [Microbulbifer sp. VAAF005]
MQEELIFIGNQVSCRYVSVSDVGTPLAITFQQRLPENVDKSINQLGFAQRFLEKIKINAFHVLIHENHWYQTGEIFECIEAIKKDPNTILLQEEFYMVHQWGRMLHYCL